MGKFLNTAFKLRPTRWKAAALMRTQLLVDGVFRDLLEAA